MRRIHRVIRLTLWLALVVSTLALSGYYLLFRTLPFAQSEGMAQEILSASSRPRIASDLASGISVTRYKGSRPQERPSALVVQSIVKPLSSSDQSAATAIIQPSQRSSAQRGTVERGQIVSRILGVSRPFLLYLPPGYAASHERYAVLYLLHGAPGTYKDWVNAAGINRTLDALLQVGRIPPLIVVMPDGNGGYFADSEWANNGNGTVRVEDDLTEEVVPYI